MFKFRAVASAVLLWGLPLPASGVRWHHERMPEEKHSTIYHPAAFKAFRVVFKPAAGR